MELEDILSVSFFQLMHETDEPILNLFYRGGFPISFFDEWFDEFLT